MKTTMAVGVPMVIDNKRFIGLGERVRMAEEWREASRRAELDDLAAAVADELRNAPLERLSRGVVSLVRRHHTLYEGHSLWHGDEMKNELNARLAGVQVTGVFTTPRQGLLHRVCRWCCISTGFEVYISVRPS
jgi:hypothetical protein